MKVYHNNYEIAIKNGHIMPAFEKKVVLKKLKECFEKT
jgi:hypothetical protein